MVDERTVIFIGVSNFALTFHYPSSVDHICLELQMWGQLRYRWRAMGWRSLSLLSPYSLSLLSSLHLSSPLFSLLSCSSSVATSPSPSDCSAGCSCWCDGDLLGRRFPRVSITQALGRLLTNLTSRGRGGGGGSACSASIMTGPTWWEAAISSSWGGGVTFILLLHRSGTFRSVEPGPVSGRPKILMGSFRPCCSSSSLVSFSWATSLFSNFIAWSFPASSFLMMLMDWSIESMVTGSFILI